MSVPWWAYYVLKEGYVSDYYSVQFIQPKKWGNLKTTDILQTWVSVFIGFSGSTSWGSRGCIILFHGLNCTIRPYNGSWVWFNINNNFSNIYSYFEKGILGGFAFTQVLQGNLKELHERPWTYVCECYRKAAKVGSPTTASVRKSVLIISHITFRDCRVHIFSDNLSQNSCILSSRFFIVIR